MPAPAHSLRASLTHDGRVFELHSTGAESLSLSAIDLPSRDPGGLCPVVWSVTLLTPWFPAISEQLELLDGELEVRVVGRHCKDDSEQLFVWRYSLDGAPLPLRPERA